MNKFPWIKPIILRSSNEEHRQASWLELFVDLGFVVAIGSTSQIFEDGFSINNLLIYSGVFFAIFWIWNRFTWYATFYDNDDIPFRLSFLLSIFCVVSLSNSIKEILAGQYFYFTICYLLLEIILLCLWIRVWRNTPNRTQAKYFFVGYLIGTTLITSSLFFKDETKLIFWILAVLFEALGPIVAWYRVRGQIPVHTNHIIERHGLFTIILLGEGVVAISNNMPSPLLLYNLVPLIAGYGIVIVLWWIYFDCGFGFSTNLSRNMLRTFIFGYGQFFVFLSLSIVTVSLEYGLHSLLNAEHSEPTSINVVKNMLLGGVSGFLLVMSAIQVIISNKNPKRIYLFRLACGAAIALCLFFQVDLAFQTIMAVVLSVLILVAINDTYQWGKLKKE